MESEDRTSWEGDGGAIRAAAGCDAGDGGSPEGDRGASKAAGIASIIASIIAFIAFLAFGGGMLFCLSQINAPYSSGADGQAAGYCFDGAAPDLVPLGDIDTETDTAAAAEWNSGLRLDLYTGAVYIAKHRTPYIGPDGSPLVLPQAKLDAYRELYGWPGPGIKRDGGGGCWV